MAAIPKLKQPARDAIAKGQVPGLAIAIVYKDEVVYLGGFGVREAGKPGKVDADTVFQLASFSKPMSATVVAGGVVSDGVVAWDSRIADLVPPSSCTMLIRPSRSTPTDLFNHRSGLSGNAGNDLEDLGYDRATILSRLHLLKPTSSFRAGDAYSNFGLTEGAVAAAKPTGKLRRMCARRNCTSRSAWTRPARATPISSTTRIAPSCMCRSTENGPRLSSAILILRRRPAA